MGSTVKKSAHQHGTVNMDSHTTKSLSQITWQFQMTLNRDIFAGKIFSGNFECHKPRALGM